MRSVILKKNWKQTIPSVSTFIVDLNPVIITEGLDPDLSNFLFDFLFYETDVDYKSRSLADVVLSSILIFIDWSHIFC